MNILPVETRTALAQAADGDAARHEWLRQRMKELESLKQARGLECCAISRAEHDAIRAFLSEHP